MYKSSSLTVFLKYIFIPCWSILFLSGIIFGWVSKVPSLQDWSRHAAVIVAWALPWLLILMIRLRTVTATKEFLIVKTFSGQKYISYGDIDYVSQTAMTSPVLISIKYHDNKTGKPKKILIIPGWTLGMNKFIEDHDMTIFIREQIMNSNLNYSTTSEPSRWLPFGLLILTGLFVGLIVKNFL